MAISESCSSKQTFCALNKETVSSISELNFTYSPPPTQFTQEITDEIWNEIIDEIVKIYNYGARGIRNPGVNSGTWKKDNTGWWFEYANGSYPKNAWIYEAGTYWHFNSSGYYDNKTTTKPNGSITYILGPFSLDQTQPADTSDGNETYNSAVVPTAQRNTKHKSDGQIIPLDEYNAILNTIGLSSLSNLNTIITEEKFNTIKTTINNLKLNNTRCNNCNVKCNQKCEASTQCYCDCDCYCYDCGECYTQPCYYHTCSQCSGANCFANCGKA